MCVSNHTVLNRKVINVLPTLFIYCQNPTEFMPASHPIPPSLPRSFNFCGNLVESRERRPRIRLFVRPQTPHAAAVERRRSTPAATLICEFAKVGVIVVDFCFHLPSLITNIVLP